MKLRWACIYNSEYFCNFVVRLWCDFAADDLVKSGLLSAPTDFLLKYKQTMIISHKHKFIFIKTKKTAGTSLEIALSKLCGKTDVLTPIIEEDEVARKEYANISAQNFYIPFKSYSKFDFLHFLSTGKRLKYYNHISCKELKDRVPIDVWNNYFKFTIERNPFDKIVSLFYWKGGDKKYGSIYNFLVGGGLKKFNGYDYYSIDGIVAVDQVYRFEDMDNICDDLTKRLQLKEPLKMPEYRAKSKKRKVNDYKDVLDDKSKVLIEQIFAREIKLLDYKY